MHGEWLKTSILLCKVHTSGLANRTSCPSKLVSLMPKLLFHNKFTIIYKRYTKFTIQKSANKILFVLDDRSKLQSKWITTRKVCLVILSRF